MDLGEPTQTLVACWMPKPLPPRNQCTGRYTPAPLLAEHQQHLQKYSKKILYILEDGASGMQVGDIEYTVGELQCATIVITPMFSVRIFLKNIIPNKLELTRG